MRRPKPCESCVPINDARPRAGRVGGDVGCGRAAGAAAAFDASPRLTLVDAGGGAAGDVHPLSRRRHHHRQLLLDPKRPPRRSVRRRRQLSGHARRPGVLARARQQHRLCGERHSADDCAVAGDGGLGQRQDRRPAVFAAVVLHSDRAADDRGRQYLAVLLRAGLRPARPDARPVRHPGAQLARRPVHRADLPDRGRGLEGCRLLHDLLSGGAAADVAAIGRSRVNRRRRPLVFLPPYHTPAVDADDLVRPDQRHHQFVPADRPYRGHDPGRPGQHHGVAFVLHLRSRLQVLGHRLCGNADGGAARFAGDCSARSVPHSRPPDPLSMSMLQTTSRGDAALETAGAWLLALIWILPLAYALWAAIHPSAYSAHFVLDAPLTLENFARAWNAAPFARYFLNTFLLVTMILAAQLVLCTLAAYAFARFTFAGRDIAFILVLLQLMIMPDVLIVENYRTMSALGIVDTIPAIGLPYMASAFGIFLLRQTFKSVPRELDEAARVEGAGPLMVLLKVYVPLAKPVYIAYGLVSVSYHWNNFLWPLIVTNSVNTRPLTVGLQIFASTDQGIDWSVITAATLMTSAPLLVAFLLFQRQFVQSFMRAGIR